MTNPAHLELAAFEISGLVQVAAMACRRIV